MSRAITGIILFFMAIVTLGLAAIIPDRYSAIRPFFWLVPAIFGILAVFSLWK